MPSTAHALVKSCTLCEQERDEITLQEKMDDEQMA